ncbi:methyltransferase domain-containing protein [Labrys monachus]|uniref:SAM-dependent methyltransferase n=1 Tax=Labrys monachus TaxID=217067 RepID=A0ABU0FP33_9HYPH|nr:methyltransferase domain-containing protein [Labrys monachus]MDQ0396291.1 SAM-dependent methyltransferase [Labrys monachus]
MSLDVVDLRDFYETNLGRVAARLIGGKIRARWQDVTGLRVAGVGFAVPYLALFRDEAERVLSFNPATQGVLEWPNGGPIAAALVEETELPLADGCIDRVLAVHLLEEAESASDTLREIWRVLAPGGTVILVAPNRRGVWARSDATPFGNGRPFSRPQLMRLLRDALFSPVNWTEALYLPPFIHGWALRSAPTYERLAERLAFPFAGVHIVEASKQVFRPITVRTRRISAPRFRPVLIPSPAGLSGVPVPRIGSGQDPAAHQG